MEKEILTGGRKGLSGTLFGLLLAGGYSRRMGRPKATIVLDGVPMYQRGLDILEGVCKRVFISCRVDSSPDLLAKEHIEDRYGSNGPVSGILSALEKHKDVSWLVIPVDMPWLTSTFLNEVLIKNRGISEHATVVRDLNGNVVQPLVAIYEPSCISMMQGAFKRGNYSLREILKEMNVHYVDVDDPRILTNRNYPEDWSEDPRS